MVLRCAYFCKSQLSSRAEEPAGAHAGARKPRHLLDPSPPRPYLSLVPGAGSQAWEGVSALRQCQAPRGGGGAPAASPHSAPSRQSQIKKLTAAPAGPFISSAPRHLAAASHKLCEVVHGGDEALPLASLVGGQRLSWRLRGGFGVGRVVHLHQGQAGVCILGGLTDLRGDEVSSASLAGLARQP